METLVLILSEHRTLDKESNSIVLQKTITSWLTKELDHPTNDACAALSAQAFKINSCQTAAHKV